MTVLLRIITDKFFCFRPAASLVIVLLDIWYFTLTAINGFASQNSSLIILQFFTFPFLVLQYQKAKLTMTVEKMGRTQVLTKHTNIEIF